MMKLKDNGEFIECWGNCYISSEERLYGAIKKDQDGPYVFHPARRAFLTCRQLVFLSRKLSDFNKAGTSDATL